MARSDDAAHLQQLFEAIYAVVRKVPRGRVATYGQVAELAGIPNGGRVAGAAMKGSGQMGLPWQRIIGKASKTTGRIAIHDPIGAAVQRALLEKEGVEVGATGLVDLTRFGLTALPGRAARPRRPPRSGSRRRASPSRR